VGRWEESSGTAAFAGGEGAPVVMVKCDEVLQLGRGMGVRKLHEIARIGDLGRNSPGNGRRWWRSVGIRAREGLPVAGGDGPGVGSGGERCRTREGAGEVLVTEEQTGVRACFERPVGGAAEGEKGRERGGVMGPGPDRLAVPSSGPSVARASDVCRTRVAGRKQRGGEGLTGGPQHSVGCRCR
jgi:hypothetical protein